MSRVRLVVFDLDGTLVDSSAAIVATLDAVLVAHGFAAAPRQAAIDLIGLPLAVMFPRLAGPELDASAVDALINTYKEHYPERAARHEVAIPGALDLVARLAGAGHRLAIATSKGSRGAEAAVVRHGLATHFDLVLGFDAVARPKPAPDMLQLAMDRLGAGPKDTVMVGDTEYDVAMGRAAGTGTIGVTWGSHDAERLTSGGADVVVHSVAELQLVLEGA